jgi:hypothetical protein
LEAPKSLVVLRYFSAHLEESREELQESVTQLGNKRSRVSTLEDTLGNYSLLLENARLIVEFDLSSRQTAETKGQSGIVTDAN